MMAQRIKVASYNLHKGIGTDRQRDPARILNAGLYNPETKSADVKKWLQAEAYEGSHDHGHGHEADGHVHEAPVSADHDGHDH